MPDTRKDLVWIKRIALLIAAGLLIYFIIMTVIIPVSRFNIEIPEKITGKDNFNYSDLNWQLKVGDSVKNKTIALLSQEAFLLSRLVMTKSDSISLAVSLQDSSISLVVQGVTIYSAKIQAFWISNAIKKTDSFILAQWLSLPFTVNTHFSSIPKVPVLYKKAPKDTIEAMNQLELDPMKDDLDPVYFSMNLDRKLFLRFEQAEKPVKGNIKQLKAYKRQLKTTYRKEIFYHLLRFSPIEFVPEIKIVLDKKAARVIYRALPVDAFVAIQLPE